MKSNSTSYNFVIEAWAKPAACLIFIGLFLLIALASLGPDEATNTSVPVSNCESAGIISGQLRVEITVKDRSGNPIPFGYGSMFIVHQKIKPGECEINVTDSKVVNVDIDSEGRFVYIGDHWLHDNTEDLFRVEIDISGAFLYSSFRSVQVQKHNIGIFEFEVIALPIL